MAHLHCLIRLLAVMLLTAISLPSSAEAFYSAEPLRGRCLPLDQLCSELDQYFEKGSKPSGWHNYQWHRLVCNPPFYRGYRTGTLPDGRSVGGNNQNNIYGVSIITCGDCPQGQERQPDGTCKPKENTCKYAENERIPGVYSMPSSFKGNVSVCLSGCRSWFVPYRNGSSSDGRIYGHVYSYGESCTAGGEDIPSSAPNEDPRTKCIEKGMHYGESNGVIVCVPKGNSGGGNQGGGNQGGGNNGGNGGNQGGGNQGGGNQGGDSGGGNGGGSGGGGGGNGSGNGSGGGNGSGNGSGGGGGGGSGGGKDEGKENEYCKENPDALACLKSGTPTDEEGLPRKEIGIKGINPFSLGGPGTCPANIELPHGAYVTFETVCQYARAIRPFLLLFAWISAFYIVFPTRGRD